MVELFLVLCVITPETTSPGCHRVPTTVVYPTMEACKAQSVQQGKAMLKIAADQVMAIGATPVGGGIACKRKNIETSA